MESSVDVVKLISTLLDNDKYKEALSVPHEEKLVEKFKDSSWDLVSTIIRKIEVDTVIIKPSLQNACEQLLMLIAEKAQPEEALLEFIEQTELAKNDAQFIISLNPLRSTLLKLVHKRGRSLEWCLNAISTYIEAIPLPEHSLEGNERLLLDCDVNVRRIMKVFTEIPTFYQPFIREFTLGNITNNPVTYREVIATFLISLLGRPLLYIDVDPDQNIESEARVICSIILKDICTLEKNLLKFLPFLENCNREKKKSKKTKIDHDEEVSPLNQIEKVNMTSLSGLFYIIYSDHFELPDNAIPQVYSTRYVINTTLLSVIHLLNFTEYGPLTKANALFKGLIERMPPIVEHSVLESSIFYDVLKSLVNITIYCSYETVRKDSIQIIGSFIKRFDFKGRCALIKYLFDASNHSGMIGYAITLYKDSINEAFTKNIPIPDCFSGQQFTAMLKKICYLPHGAESDLVELADQIITALNFLRYLTVKDVNNMTGLKENFPFLEDIYLKQLRTGLNMSKAHYEVKLKDIEEAKKLPDESVDVSINIAGNVLDKLPLQNKKDVILSAINAFHLIECLMASVSECININKIKNNF